MVKIDGILSKINEISEIGRENAELMPKVKGWCEHLTVEGFMQGMVAEMKGLANYVSLTCPHAAFPCQWYRVSYVAEEFIARNCLNCSFHKTRWEPNYGQTVVKKLKIQSDEKAEQEKLRADLAQKITQETNTLIATGAKLANPTQLSILKMLSKLADESERSKTAAQLSAAAKLDPTFFSNDALDVLLMYIDDELAGNDCIDAVHAVMIGRGYFPERAFELAKRQIQTSEHFDKLAKFLAVFINTDNVSENEDSIEILINRLWYKRFIGEPANPERNYQNAEKFLIELGKANPDVLTKILRKSLLVNEKNKRINTNLLLQRLVTTLPDLVIGLTKEIIKSLELADDEYEQSADHITLETLQVIMMIDPERTFETLCVEKAKLSIDAKAVLVGLTIRLLSDRAFTDHQPQITATLVDELTGYVLNKNVPDEIRKEATHQLSYFVNDRPELFQSSFDGFLGYLSQISEEETLFRYYREELERKNPNEYTTFNYLIGKNFLDIKHIEQEIHSRYQDIKKILGKLCRYDPQKNLPKVYSIIPEIDSGKNEKYKRELISIVREYVKEPITLAGFIPQLHGHLLDPNSQNIRYDALKILDSIFDRFPILITSSLWELFDVFIKENDVIVKGMALTILGTIAKRFPERITSEYLSIHKAALFNQKVFIHSRAIYITDELHPFMDTNQRYEIIGLLLQLADLYSKEADGEDVFESIIDQLLYFTADQPKVIYNIASRYIQPQTEKSDYYQAKDQIRKLKTLSKESPDVAKLWLKSMLSYLIRFPYDISAQEQRLDFYYDMHHIDRKFIVNEEENLRVLLTLPGTAANRHFDIAHILNLLGYFEWYELIAEITAILKSKYQEVEANKPLLQYIEYWHLVASSELSSDKQEKLNNLKAAENVFK